MASCSPSSIQTGSILSRHGENADIKQMVCCCPGFLFNHSSIFVYDIPDNVMGQRQSLVWTYIS
jgi:hypothetical protein